MNVDVRLGGHLSWYDPQKRSRLTVRFEEPTHPIDVLVLLGIPAAEVAIVAVNGELVDVNKATIADGDRLDLLPPIGGG